MFQLGSHKIVHIPNCVVQHPLINRVAGVVRRALIDADVAPYTEAAHIGVARYLQVVVERSSQTAQVVLVANSPTVEPLATCLDLIRERLGNELHSLWFNPQCERSNAILGPEFENWSGPDSIIERFGGAAVHYPPGAFGQNNLDIAELIVGHVRDRVPQGARVAEFYAGVGAIGLSLLPRVHGIRMNEVSPHSLRGLALGLADLDQASRAKVDGRAWFGGRSVYGGVGCERRHRRPATKRTRSRAARVLVRTTSRAILVRELWARIVARRHPVFDIARQAAPARPDRLQPDAIHGACRNRRLLRPRGTSTASVGPAGIGCGSAAGMLVAGVSGAAAVPDADSFSQPIVVTATIRASRLPRVGFNTAVISGFDVQEQGRSPSLARKWTIRGCARLRRSQRAVPVNQGRSGNCRCFSTRLRFFRSSLICPSVASVRMASFMGCSG